MKLIFLGPPGAGKGTHAKILIEKYGMVHLSTGDILRKNIREKTELGIKAKDTIEKGELVSDHLINALMVDEIGKLDLKKGFLLDGYPRTIGQAKGLDEYLVKNNIQIDAVLDFVTSEVVIIDRLSGRRVAPTSGRVYHVRNLPPKVAGKCDESGEDLIQRKDDQPETVKNRLKVYHEETEPLIEFYKKKALHYQVTGDKDVPNLQEEIMALFAEIGIA